MAKRKAGDKTKDGNGANVGYESQFWQMADTLYIASDPFFFRYISDVSEEQRAMFLSRIDA